jgi:hypothetical protein
MATVSNLNKYLTQGAIEGFSELIAPLTAFSYVVKPGASALNDVVRVPFAQNTSASNAFSYATGYAADGNTVTGKSVTLDNLMYQRISMTDSELSLLNPESIIRVGRQAGNRLASDFISASFASCLTQANFGNSGSLVAGNYTSSVALAALDKAANDLKWPDGERTLIAGTTLWQALMNNSSVVSAQNFGSAGPIQQGKLNSVLGFVPYKVTIALPNSATGFACNPNGLLIANAYHAPTDGGTQYIDASQIVDEKTGLTIGFRQFYDPTLATSYRVFDVLGGCGVGNSNAVYWIK